MSTPMRRAAILLFYVALALWPLRVVLPDLTTTIATGADPPKGWQQIIAADQKLVVAVVAAHGRALTIAPAPIRDGPQCHPVRHALMMGQHELGEGMLGVVPWLLSRDPVVTYNVVMLLSIVLPGLAMHALVREWTGSTAAAFVAGTLFATHPSRLGDVVHLSAIGNYWTVVALLFLWRLFLRPSWGAAIGLGLAAGAQTLESIYPLIPHAFLCGTLALWLAWRRRSELPSLAPKLAVAAVFVVGSAVVVLGPYLDFRATWGSLAGREQLRWGIGAFRFGGPAYSGTVALVLAAIGLADRFRRREPSTPPPHLPLLVAGVLAAWTSIGATTVPGVGTIPSLFTIIGAVLPGLDAIRRGSVMVSGWHLVVIVLAGFGVGALVRERRTAIATALGALLVGLAWAEIFVPAAARASFGRPIALAPMRVAPPAPLRALYGRMEPGAVLDVPFELGPGRFFRMADFVLAGAYHERKVGACYNSFRVALQEDVVTYAARVLTDARAAEALAALGFRNLVQHLGLPSRTPPPQTPPPHLAEIGRAAGQVLYRMPDAPPTTGDPRALETRVDANAQAATALVFRNPGTLLFRHADPIEPSALTLRWLAEDDAVLAEHPIRILLPSVLPAGEELRRPLRDPAPRPAGAVRYDVLAYPTDFVRR
jgi:hypothetical protein